MLCTQLKPKAKSLLISNYEPPGLLQILATALRVFNYFFTAVFIMESAFKVAALGFERYLNDKWNQLDVVIVFLSIVGIVLEELESEAFLPINPTILRVMRVMRIARGTRHIYRK